jgi:hypothetical protein
MVAAWLSLSSIPSFAAQDPATDEEPSWSIRTSYKGSLLAARAPDAPLLYPERDSLTSFWRLRLEPEVRIGARATAAFAYEHRFRAFSESAGLSGFGILPPDTPAPYRIRQLDWIISASSGSSWHHEIDRAYLAVALPRVNLTLGRQAVGWGRGVLFGAVDIFSPFNPLEADRAWRRGVDAMRADFKLSERSSLDVVGAFGEAFDESALAARFRGYKGNLDLEVVGGWRARDFLAGVTSSAAVGDAELHGELAIFRTPESLPDAGLEERRSALKAVAGGSYRLPLGNGILMYAEYHYSGFGAANASEILPLLADPEFLKRYLRGDTQILERHAIAVLATYEASPEIAFNAQWIQSPVDGSGVASPSMTWTLGDRLSILASFYISYGAPPEGLALASTYGAAADSGFLQIRVYF